MIRVFLDANILYSAAKTPLGTCGRLWELPHVELVTSEYVGHEAWTNLDTAEERDRLQELMSRTEFVSSAEMAGLDEPILFKSWNLPDKDVPVLAAAVYAGADYLVTGDADHFGEHFGRCLDGVTVVSMKGLFRVTGMPKAPW